MKTDMQQTSLNAYQGSDRSRQTARGVIYAILKKIQPAHNQQIAKELGWEINRVTGRIKELRELGLVGFSHFGTNCEGRKVMCWKILNSFFP